VNSIILEATGWTLLHFLWQGLAIGAIYGLFLGAFRTSPQVRYLIGCLTLLLMLGVVGKTYHSQFRSLNEKAQAQASPSPVVYQHAAITFSQCQSCHTVADNTKGEFLESKKSPSLPLSEEISTSSSFSWAMGIWLVGVILLFLRLVISHFVTLELRRNHSGLPNASVISSIERISSQVGVKSLVQIFMSESVAIPSVIGWLRPVILLPVGTVAGLSRTQLDAILAHELAHIRRRDYLVNLLQHLLEIVFFFHPAVWFVSSTIRKEREFCCDDIAATTSKNTVDYARALATLEALRNNRPALGMAANGGSLLTRIKRLGGEDKPRSTSLLLGSTFILFAAISIPLTIPPTHAETIRKETPAGRVELLPLPSSEAEKGLRHFLTKTREENIPYEDFSRLTKSLDETTLRSLIEEIESMEDKGYQSWTRKALIEEQAFRIASSLPSSQIVIPGCVIGTSALIDAGDLD